MGCFCHRAYTYGYIWKASCWKGYKMAHIKWKLRIQIIIPQNKNNTSFSLTLPSAHLRLFRLVHLTQDVFRMRLESREAGGFRRRRRVFCFLRFLLSSFLDLRHLRGLGGLGHLWGFGRLGRFGGFGSFLSGFLSAGRGDVGWGNRLFGLRVGGWWFLHLYPNAWLALNGFGCILEIKAGNCVSPTELRLKWLIHQLVDQQRKKNQWQLWH